VLNSVAAEVANASGQGIEVAIVVGGGNYFRGANAWEGLDRATADNMGMLATCMNAICLQVSACKDQASD
jgi:uridylate kinase